MRSKAERVRKLAAAGFNTREVAQIVGCCTAYVRAVKAREIVKVKGNREVARKASRDDYRDKKNAGMSSQDAYRASRGAYWKALRVSARNG